VPCKRPKEKEIPSNYHEFRNEEIHEFWSEEIHNKKYPKKKNFNV
jgi:hypothetical protein